MTESFIFLLGRSLEPFDLKSSWKERISTIHFVSIDSIYDVSRWLEPLLVRTAKCLSRNVLISSAKARKEKTAEKRSRKLSNREAHKHAFWVCHLPPKCFSRMELRRGCFCSFFCALRSLLSFWFLNVQNRIQSCLQSIQN